MSPTGIEPIIFLYERNVIPNLTMGNNHIIYVYINKTLKKTIRVAGFEPTTPVPKTGMLPTIPHSQLKLFLN